MEKAKQWIESLRLSMTIPAGLLACAGFTITGQKIDWGISLIIFLVAIASMLQNDYWDRRNDRKKEKYLAYKNSRLFMMILIVLWSIEIILSLRVLSGNIYQGAILLLLIIGGIIYSESRRKLLLPMISVALISASPPLLAISLGINPVPIFILSASVFFVISGREILKDIEDAKTDRGYKKTLLSEDILSDNKARKVSAILMLIGIFISRFISPEIYWINITMYWIGLILAAGGTFAVFFSKDHSEAKNILDIGIIMIIISFSFHISIMKLLF